MLKFNQIIFIFNENSHVKFLKNRVVYVSKNMIILNLYYCSLFSMNTSQIPHAFSTN